MKNAVCVVLYVVAILAVVRADTVAWYQFSEGDTGTSPAGGEGVILNSVDAGKYPAKAYRRGSAYKITTEASSLPVYNTNGFPHSEAVIYNPVTLESEACNKALSFCCENSGDKDYGSILLIEDDETFLSGSYTVECYFKWDTNVTAGAWRSLVVKDWGLGADGKSTGEEYSIRVLVNGRMEGTIKVEDPETKALENITCGIVPSNINLLDGLWHHAALVVDGELEKISLHIDHILSASKSFAGKNWHRQKGVITIGNTLSKDYGTWPGLIDSVRFSNEALPAGEFLQIGKQSKKAYPDTVAYDSFESFYGWFSITGTPTVVNEIHRSAFEFNYCPNNGRGYFDYVADDTPGSTMRKNVFDANNNKNAGSVYLEDDENCYGPYFSVSDAVDGKHASLTNSFTIEGIFRIPSKVKEYFDADGNELAKQSYLFCVRSDGGTSGTGRGSILCRLASSGSVTLEMRGVNESSTRRMSSARSIRDDKRHHVAIVYDYPRRTVYLYCDYRLEGGFNSFEFDCSANPQGEGILVCGGYGDKQLSLHGYIDEFRLTTRALRSQEFLTSSKFAEALYSAWIDFENDMEIAPYKTESPDGEIAGSVVCSAADVGGRYLAGEYRGRERENLSALSINKGTLTYNHTAMMEQSGSGIVEFFVKTKTFSGKADIAGFNGICIVDGVTQTNNLWRISYDDNGMLNVVCNGNTVFNGESIDDSKWHHMALVFAGSKDNENSGTVTFYLDYKVKGGCETSDFPPGNIHDSYLVFGDKNFVGCMDEFRVTPGGVSPLGVKFLEFYNPGTIIIIR